ncbi:hypothetical protein OSH10_09995 [Kaistia defluvii]|nr:hypothetical protein [Kaistia defluvii]MCX5518767.1 hypothetical protein [Kaistia defluvii]
MATTRNSTASTPPSGCGTCRNCSSLFWGIGASSGLRCVGDAGKGRSAR